MNYELAKQLKAAGFPKQTFRIILPTAKYPHRKGQENSPTLSELIADCQKTGVFKMWFLKDGSAGVQLEGESADATVFYPTPDEAVARLWLLRNGSNKSN